jgi:hypothetical protein
MPYFNLLIVDTRQILSNAIAPNRETALDAFGNELGVKLTFSVQKGAAPYLFEEWSSSPHWVSPSIPVYEGE